MVVSVASELQQRVLELMRDEIAALAVKEGFDTAWQAWALNYCSDCLSGRLPVSLPPAAGLLDNRLRRICSEQGYTMPPTSRRRVRRRRR